MVGVPMRSVAERSLRRVVLVSMLLLVASCSSLTVEPPQANREDNPRSRITGEGINLLNIGGSRSQSNSGGGGAIGVNSFLWRASLDTVAFMPLTSADPFGGVIISDWYSPPESPDERFKVMVYILGGQLRADGVRAQIFRQRRGGPSLASANGRGGGRQGARPATGDWIDVQVDPNVPTELENAILTRARQLRIDSTARS
jgi:hypothetical protein